MMRVADEWKYSCEHNLTALQNRRAWIGHAACALAFKCPEYIVRRAWGFLTESQRDSANNEADKAIKHWEEKYAKENKEIYQQLEFEWLSKGDTRRSPE